MVELIAKKGKCCICKNEFDLLVSHGYELYCIECYTRKILKKEKKKDIFINPLNIEFIKNLNKKRGYPFFVIYEGDDWLGTLEFYEGSYILTTDERIGLNEECLDKIFKKLKKLNKYKIELKGDKK